MDESPHWLKKVIKDFATAADGQTYAIGRIMSVPAFVLGNTGFGVAILKNGTVDLLALGTGYAVMLGGIAGLIYGTNLTEKKP